MKILYQEAIFMKNLLAAFSVIAFICFFDSCATLGSLDYPQPEFDKPSAYVIDAFSVKGSFEDYVKLHNNSADSNMNFNVYVHHPGSHEWVLYGIGILKGFGDTDTIDSGIIDDDIDKYRYFAIESLNGKNYKYSISKSRNDLHITISD
jgi:hypothetical protein